VFINGKRKGTTPTQAGQKLVLEEGEYRLGAKTDAGLGAKLVVFVPGGGIHPAHLKMAADRNIDPQFLV